MNTTTNIIGKRELRKIRRVLRGRYAEIAEHAKVTKAAVCYVLNGDFHNEAVMSKALEIYNELTK